MSLDGRTTEEATYMDVMIEILLRYVIKLRGVDIELINNQISSSRT